MAGWIVPPPKICTKSPGDFARERKKKVERLIRDGILRSARIEEAMRKVAREDFIPSEYKDYAYREVPLPLPGEQSTISCPHSYPLFYEPLGLGEGHRFLEVGLGSGYGTALAREIVGPEGLVVGIEIDPVTFEFAGKNLRGAGYGDIVLVRGDGGLGHPEGAPYDRICITAACPEFPAPLMGQLAIGGKLIGPLEELGAQNLVLLEKGEAEIKRKTICRVLYVPLRGRCGWYA